MKIRSIGRAFRSVEGDSDDDSFEDAIDLASAVSLATVKKKRYLFRSPKYRKGPSRIRFKMDLELTGDFSRRQQIYVEQPVVRGQYFEFDEHHNFSEATVTTVIYRRRLCS